MGKDAQNPVWLQDFKAERPWQPPYTSVDVAVLEGGGVVGYCAWTREESLWRRSAYILILSVAVTSMCRGCRIGEMLLRQAALVGATRYPLVDAVILHVRADNAAAQRLYRRCGFQLVAK